MLTFITLISISMVYGSNIFTTRKLLLDLHVAPSTTNGSTQHTLYDHIKRLAHDAPNPPTTPSDPHPSPWFDAIKTAVPSGPDPLHHHDTPVHTTHRSPPVR